MANKKKLGQLKGNEFLVKTIVTTEVIARIAEKNGVELRDCYTGFKWIANEIRISEGKQKYIGGGEESFGFLPFDKVRDKDSPASICLICEIAAWARDNGKTLYDLLMDIYAEYGFSREFTVNVVRPGKTGADEIKQMMENFRANPPKDLAGSEICLWKDFKSLEARKPDGSIEKIDMPDTSNVLQWFCVDGTKVKTLEITEVNTDSYVVTGEEYKATKEYYNFVEWLDSNGNELGTNGNNIVRLLNICLISSFIPFFVNFNSSFILLI